MSFIIDKTKEINCKIVFFGPAGAGKSTSLKRIYDDAAGGSGERVSLTHDENTLYFDFVPLSVGKIGGYTVRLHLYTIPGEAGYKQSRALISKGIDGVIFVADSQLPRMEDNIKSLAALKDMLKGEGHGWGEVPCVFAYNKRDLKDAVPAEEMRRYLNKDNLEDFETVATDGQGVLEAFRSVSAAVLRDLKQATA